MAQALRAFLGRPTTKAGIAVALAVQIIFSVIWMTGYSGVNDRTNQFGIAVVSDDRQIGDQLAQQLVKELPFQMSLVTSVDEAKRLLNEREVQMVVHVPADFTAKAAGADEGAKIQYWINESNSTMVKGVMTAVSGQITAQANSQASAAGISSVLQQQGMTADAAQAAGGKLSDRVAADVQSMNVVSGMNNQMVPMMIVLASWVGAMIMALNFKQTSLAIGTSIGKWRLFGAQMIVTVCTAVVVSLIGAGLLVALGGQMNSGFGAVWLFELLMLLTFMLVSQMFIHLLGMAGMFMNILFMSLQLVSSGATTPRELLPSFFHTIGTFMPATYGVEGGMSLLFGGPSASADVLMLVLISGLALLVSLATVFFKKSPSVGQQQVAPRAVSPLN
ncbi:YhgE/Pip domain-containing protein [Paenibacillus herberti]|uniref:ABC transporter n=1 Tax=Paenibacillus herberti TaxID=1619309 RepID=A0A229NW04_9BACL|nr:ABC transporter permease [Paenibacillus herberti]OXM14048.1 ABC transporter [Paenibacillus herberti]